MKSRGWENPELLDLLEDHEVLQRRVFFLQHSNNDSQCASPFPIYELSTSDILDILGKDPHSPIPMSPCDGFWYAEMRELFMGTRLLLTIRRVQDSNIALEAEIELMLKGKPARKFEKWAIEQRDAHAEFLDTLPSSRVVSSRHEPWCPPLFSGYYLCQRCGEPVYKAPS